MVNFTLRMTDSKRMGRPPSDLPTRDKQVALFLTPEDAEWFTEFASSYGFKSRGELLTAILERVRLCGMSPVGMLRIGTQMSKRCRDANPSHYNQAGLDFSSLTLRPLPALPDVDFNTSDIQEAIAELQHELEDKAI